MDTLQELTPERFRLGFDVDVGGTLAMTQAAAPLPARRDGREPDRRARRDVARRRAPLRVTVAGRADRATRCLATILAAYDVASTACMPAITPAGGTGTIAAPVLGIEFGERFLTADQVGDAVVRLAGERASGRWTVSVDGLRSLDALQAA